MDQDQDLIDLFKNKDFPEPLFKKVITSNLIDDSMEQDEMMQSYNKIRKHFFKGEKALVIQLNETQKQVSKFEQVNHYYSLCRNDADKFLLMFALKKLNILDGKLVI